MEGSYTIREPDSEDRKRLTDGPLMEIPGRFTLRCAMLVSLSPERALQISFDGRLLRIRPPYSRKIPVSPHPRQGRFESKNPDFPCGALSLQRNGDFLSQSALFSCGGNGGFLTPKPSFPDFGVFDPVEGGRIRKETDFYTPQVLGGAALFDNSAPAVYKNPVP